MGARGASRIANVSRRGLILGAVTTGLALRADTLRADEASPAATPSSTKTFISPNYGYRIRIPATWRTDELEIEGVKFDRFFGTEVVEDRSLVLQARAKDLESLDQVIPSGVEQLKEEGVPVDVRDALIQDVYPGYVVTIPIESSNRTQTLIAFNAGSRSYYFNALITNEIASEVKRVRDILENSFEPPTP